ncbi:pyruvate kinase [Candidatus Gastranaerophilus sp. (ex Termes propinquus)]|nr:pyruvate kinase [Candidatus Gastranaerophilus sp. (ex Termes propinquus)]
MERFFKRTKIVATLGPVTANYEAIKGLIEAGANVFRLNTSHGELEDHKARMGLIRQAAADLGAYVGIMVDLQGPKIRVCKLESEIALCDGDKITLTPCADVKGHSGDIVVPVDYSGIVNDVKSGDTILIDDGYLELKVLESGGNRVLAEVINGGILKSRKGINIPGSTASLSAIGERDVKFIEFAVQNDADFIALSFVRSKEDVLVAARHIKDFGGNIPIISKIEKPQALDNLEEIISVSDYIMVARGDLGIEMPSVRVPILQKQIIQEANKQRKGVIVATQMLESMINEPIPTRAEASDVANAIIDGADAVMLSGETSVGKHARRAVETMAQIAKNIEESDFFSYDIDLEISDVEALTRQAVVFGADRMVKYVNAKAIVNFSHEGYSTRLMSKLKPCVPIVTVTTSEKTCRKLSLNWGVFPFIRNWDSVARESFMAEFDEFLKTELDFKDDEYVIIIGSSPNLISGRTNFIRVHRIGA